MKKALRFTASFIFISLLFITRSNAQETTRDTVRVGIYVTSIHAIDPQATR